MFNHRHKNRSHLRPQSKSRLGSPKALSRSHIRRALFETLEDRRLLAVDFYAANSQIYEGGPTSGSPVMPGFAGLTMIPDAGRTVLQRKITVVGDLSAVGLDAQGVGSTYTLVQTAAEINQFDLFAADDDDQDNESILVTVEFTYAPVSGLPDAESDSLTIDIDDNDHDESISLALVDSLAKEPVPANGTCNSAPADKATFKIELPTHWGSHNTPGTLYLVPTGTADIDDYSLSAQALPSGAGAVTVGWNFALNAHELTIPSRLTTFGNDYDILESYTEVYIDVTPTSAGGIEADETVAFEIILPFGTPPDDDHELFQWSESAEIEGPIPGNARFNEYMVFGDGTTSVSITIEDGGPHYAFSANPSSEKEFATAEADFGKFIVSPNGPAACASTSLFLQIAAEDLNEAGKKNSATPGVDYSLAIGGVPLDLTYDSTEKVWNSEHFAAPTSNDLEIVVIPVNDTLLEDDEIVDATLFQVVPGGNDVNEGMASVTIEEEYLRAQERSIDDSEDVGCSCTCVCGEPSVGNDGSLGFQSSVFPISFSSSPVSETQSQLFIGLPLYSDKAVPDTINVMLEGIQDHEPSRIGGSGIGAESVESIVSFALDVAGSADAANAGDTIWFSAVVDLSDHVRSAAAFTNGSGDALVNLRLIAHPQFSGSYTVDELFSGWIGYHSASVRSISGDGTIHENLPGGSEGSGAAPPYIGPPGMSLFHTQRIIDGIVLSPSDSAQMQQGPNDSVGLSQRFRGHVTPVDTTLVVEHDGRTIKFDASGNSPLSLSHISNGELVARDGSTTAFDLQGRAISVTDRLGNLTTYSYGGSVFSVTDAFGNVIRLEKYAESLTNDGVGSTISYIGFYVKDRQNPSSQGSNQTVLVDWLQTATNALGNSGTLTLTGIDPDSGLPRHAMRETYTYVNGNLTNVSIGDATGTVLRSYSIGHSTSIDAVTGAPLRFATSITRSDGAQRTFEVPTYYSGARTLVNGETYVSGNTSGNAPLWTVALVAADLPFGNTLGSQTDWNGDRSIYEFDHRGRVIRFWDPVQVESVLRDLIPSGFTDSQITTWIGAQSLSDPLIASRFLGTTFRSLSYEFERQEPTVDTWGLVSGKDLGEIVTSTAPDADNFLRRDFPLAEQTNGPLGTVETQIVYTADKNVDSTTVEGLVTSSTYNSAFDLPTSRTDEHGNVLDISRQAGTGLVDQITANVNRSIRYNMSGAFDVNNDGFLSSIDSLNVTNNLGEQDFATAGPPFYDINGDGVVTGADRELILEALSQPGSLTAGSSIETQVNYTYVSESGLPNGLVDTITVQTGRASGDMVTKFEYYNDNTVAHHGQLHKIREAYGTAAERVTTFTYDNFANLSLVTDPLGKVTRYFYDKADRLTAVLMPDPDGFSAPSLGAVIRYDYDTYGNVLAVETLNASLVSDGAGGKRAVVKSTIDGYEYDSNNRMTSEYQQRGTHTWYISGTGGNVSYSTSDPVYVSWFSTLSSIASSNTPIENSPVPGTPNSSGVTQKYAGLKTTYGYDFNGNIELQTAEDVEAIGSLRSIETKFDRLDRPVEVLTTAPGQGLEIVGSEVTSGTQYVTAFSYDNHGNLRSTTDRLGRQVEYTYDSLDRVATMQDPIGTTSFSYDSYGNGWRVTTTDPEGRMVSRHTDFEGKTTSILGDVTPVYYEYWDDGLLRLTNENGQIPTFYGYDALGQLSTVTTDGTASYVYNPDGTVSSSTDEVGRETRFAYDLSGNRLGTIFPDPDGLGVRPASYEAYTLDSLGNRLRKTSPLGTARYAYDSRYRVVEMVDEDGDIQTISFDNFGQMTSVTDANGNVTSYVYNLANQLVEETQEVPGGTDRVTEYFYDIEGNLRRIVDAEQREIIYDYDAQNRMISETWETNGVVQQRYDFDYDAAGNLLGVDDSNATWGTNFDFAYDRRDQRQLENQAIGSLTPIVFDYDYSPHEGNLTRLAVNFGGTFTQSSTLDPTDPSTITGGLSDLVNTYDYNDRNLLTAVTQQAGSGNAVGYKKVDFTYDSSSLLTSIERRDAPSNLVSKSGYAYDGAGRLTSLLHGDGTQSLPVSWEPGSALIGSEIAAYSFEYDQSNLLTRFSSLVDTSTSEYSYDATGQLTGVKETQYANIAIENWSFETPAVTTGTWFTEAPGWQRTGYAGVMRFGSAQYDGPVATDGGQAGYLEVASLSQILNEPLLPSHEYVLSVDVGYRKDRLAPDFTVGLYAGGVLLAEGTDADISIAPGEYQSLEFRYVSPNQVTAGQLLEIRLESFVSQTDFDNVQLKARRTNEIFVDNASFEYPVLADHEDGMTFTGATIDGWTKTNVTGVLNPGVAQYPFGMIPNGNQLAYLVDGSFSQVLDSVLLEDHRYTLQVDVGERLDQPAVDFTIQLKAGTSVLAELTEADLNVETGGFVTATLVYESLDSTEIGQPLEIHLSADAWQANFDNVRLSAEPIHRVNIANPSFEEPALANDGDWTVATIPGWQKTGTSGTENPNSTKFTGSSVPHGTQAAFLVAGEFTQTLSEELTPNSNYRLQVDIGDDLVHSMPNYSVELWAGTQLLDSIDNSDYPGTDGQFVTGVLEYSSGAAVPSGLLTIKLVADGWQAHFDNLLLTATIPGYVPLKNNSFELPAQANDGDWTGNPIPEWSKVGVSGVINAGPAQFTSIQATDGNQIAYIVDGNFTQALDVYLIPNMDYHIKVDIGDRLDLSLPYYAVELLADNTVIAQTTIADLATVDGAFVTSVLNYRSADNDQHLGKQLSVRLVSTDWQATFDNVRLTANPVGPLKDVDFAYDSEGNRLDASGNSPAPSGSHNRVSHDDNFNYTYDLVGNLVQRVDQETGAVVEYDWDHRNRLTKVTALDSLGGSVQQIVSYTYDAFDRRTVKRLDDDGDGTDDVYWAFVHHGDHTLYRLVDTDGPGTSEKFRIQDRYLYGAITDMLLADEQYAAGAGPELSATTASGTSGEVLWPLGDHLGSIRDVIDNAGTQRVHVAYDSFGNRVSENYWDSSAQVVAKGDPGAVDILFGYAGRDWDEDISLQYNRARWYDPAQGRWISQDPIGFAAGDANLYRYVGNGPTNATDPSGSVVIFVHGINTENDEEANAITAALNQYWDDNGIPRQEVIHFRYGIFGALHAWNDTWSSGNARAGRDLRNLIASLARERSSLGSKEPINVLAYSNGSNVAFEALSNCGIKNAVENLVFVGGSIDQGNDFASLMPGVTALHSFSSKRTNGPFDNALPWAAGHAGDWATQLVDGVGSQGIPQYTLDENPWIVQHWVKNVYHSRGEPWKWYGPRGGSAWSTERQNAKLYPGNNSASVSTTWWLTQYMVLNHYSSLLSGGSDRILSNFGLYGNNAKVLDGPFDISNNLPCRSTHRGK